ncbi:ABC transporter substrate-binding protein [Anaerobacillus sp. MEB173]|uniref:ABC transporter substrate-binding protein n=1 Tax=Anaerobacillus sp. MEB173 TaxID=3383345 RepID=UPI003F8E34FB
MKKVFLFMMMLAIGIIAVACSDNAETGGSEGSNGVEEYKIGAIYSKTGPNSPLGEPEWNATTLLVDQINENGGINGVPVRVILADDESSQEKATQEMNRLINDEKVLAILGSSGSGPSLAMKGIAMQNNVPMISAAAAVEIVEPVEQSTWVFKTPHSDRHAVERIYMYLNENGISKVGTLTDSNAFGASGVEQLENLAGDYNIEIVSKQSYNTQDPDMRAQLTNINSSGAEVVIVWGTNPGPAVIARNIEELGLDLPFIGSHGIANQNFIDLAGSAAEGVIIPTGKLLFPDQINQDDAQYEVISSFHNDYSAAFGSEPTNFGSYGYDNLMLVIDALQAGATDREAIRDHLETAISNYVGATGIYNFTADDHNGLEADSMVIAEVVNGTWKLFE